MNLFKHTSFIIRAIFNRPIWNAANIFQHFIHIYGDSVHTNIVFFLYLSKSCTCTHMLNIVVVHLTSAHYKQQQVRELTICNAYIYKQNNIGENSIQKTLCLPRLY